MHFSTWRMVIILITALVMIGSYLLLARTAFGLRIRASLENPALARASGISTNAIYGATFAFGAALAGLAGALIVPVFSLFADLGLRFLIQGFVAVMVGGIGSFAGPVAGAGVIGTLAAGLPWIIPPVIADVLVFVVAIIFIKFRPQGLISGKGV
jgi:branched-chain amino acid transport system permease protein